MRRSSPVLGNELLSEYSAKGPLSTFSFRMRYTIMLKPQTDQALADYFFEKWLHAWPGDAAQYSYWWVMVAALGVCAGHMSRLSYFDPDVTWRKQENKKPMPDRTRQWSYCLPYYNHRLRNMVTKYKWALIDNEPDYNDHNPLGYRPDRKQCYARPYAWIFSVPRYQIQDPLVTSCTHENFNRMYEEIGYQKNQYKFGAFADED
eukprot:CAMPEP_0178402838 /NCGR_PEP_ID=MMETSP0689_2-20121128/17057_1 /TAXON_ID=160604 /ORGANISM="Amphidinium massartii, Strain CS-259" /LENGTH=203 /DNA_ID=CAMNT_0020023769 /DNA_START=137 /DNA_END=748 /DNA_ORIENTATION=-